MTVGEKHFRESLTLANCPPDFDIFQQSLWYDGKGDWETAHHLINDLTTSEAAWIHAYLHRKEGDLGNADYWYRRAGKQCPHQSFDKEWNELVNHFTKSD